MSRVAQVALVCLAVLIVTTLVVSADPAGTLVFSVRDYESDVTLKKNIVKQLEHGGVEWGIHGNELVVTMVSKKYLKPELTQFTRWGDADEVQLPPGKYRVTCVGYEQREISTNPDKVLSESAYFNEAVLYFTIHPDEITRLEVTPRIHRTGKLIRVFIPALRVEVFENDTLVLDSIISERTAQSIRWDDYSGALKF